MSSYVRNPDYRPGETLRDCSVCGLRFYFPSEFEQDPSGNWRCKQYCTPRGDVTNEYIQIRDKARASIGGLLREMPPAPGARDFTTKPTFPEEASLFEFLAEREVPSVTGVGTQRGVAPWYGLSREEGTGEVQRYPLPSATIAGEVCRYLYGVYLDPNRGTWRDRAKDKLLELCDWILTKQKTDVASTTIPYGGFRTSYGSFDEAYLSYDAAMAGLALCRAYQLTNGEAYLTGATRAAQFLRHAQCGGKLLFYPSSTDALGTTPYNSGMWTNVVVWDEKPGEWEGYCFSHQYFAQDLAGLEFLSVLQGIVGDSTFGEVSYGAEFTSRTDAKLSEMQAAAVAFWKDGIAETGSTTAISGLSAATPRQYFNSYPQEKTYWNAFPAGTHTWVSTAVDTIQWAVAIRTLQSIGGQDTWIESLWNYLRALSANPTYVAPAGISEVALSDSGYGDFDPTVCPPASFESSGTPSNATPMYDYASAGCLAEVWKDKYPTGMIETKRMLGKLRFRFADRRVQGPRDDLRLIGFSGLSMQSRYLPNAGAVYSPMYAAMVGNLYRY